MMTYSVHCPLLVVTVTVTLQKLLPSIYYTILLLVSLVLLHFITYLGPGGWRPDKQTPKLTLPYKSSEDPRAYSTLLYTVKVV